VLLISGVFPLDLPRKLWEGRVPQIIPRLFSLRHSQFVLNGSAASEQALYKAYITYAVGKCRLINPEGMWKDDGE
jgi:hypothetical protein